MKLFLSFCLIVIFCISAISIEAAITIKGKLIGYQGKPMKLAHVHEIALKETDDDIAYRVAPNGDFSFSTEAKDIIKLAFTGVDHKRYETGIILIPQDKELNINVQLSFNSIVEPPQKLTLIGSFNDYNFAKGTIDFIKNDDGIFSAEVEWHEDSLYYQVLGLINDGNSRSVNGNSPSYTYDGDGDYRSVVPVKDGKVTIVLNPEDYITEQSSPVISSKDKNLGSYFELEKSLTDQKKDFLNNIYPFTPDKYQYYYDFTNRIIDEAKKQEDRRKRIFTILTYLDVSEGGLYYGIPQKCDAGFVSKISEDIPTVSKIWGVYPKYLVNLYGLMDCDKAKKYVKDVMANNPEENPLLSITERINGIDALNSAKNTENLDNFLTGKVAVPQILDFAITLAHYRADTLAMLNILNKMYKDYETDFLTLKARYNFDPNRKIQIGNTLPDFELKDIKDSTKIYNLSTFKGKYVLVDVWATWCGPCIGELPNLSKAWDKYKGKDFMIFSISYDQSPEKVEAFRKGKFDMPWMHSFAEGGFKSDVGMKFEVMGIPRPILIDPNGKIIEMEVGLRGNSLFTTLEKFLD